MLDLKGDEHESVSELCNKNNASYDNYNTATVSGEIKIHLKLHTFMGREVGGGFMMGNTCKSMADSCLCMAKTTTIL